MLSQIEQAEERISKFSGADEGIIPGYFWNRKKMDNVNPQLGKSTWWIGNHVPWPIEGVILNNMSRKNTPGFSGCSWHVHSFLLLNRQWLNRRKLPLSRPIIIEDLNLQKKFHTVIFSTLPSKMMFYRVTKCKQKQRADHYWKWLALCFCLHSVCQR